jgi:uncharacterized membrane protein YqiK
VTGAACQSKYLYVSKSFLFVSVVVVDVVVIIVVFFIADFRVCCVI